MRIRETGILLSLILVVGMILGACGTSDNNKNNKNNEGANGTEEKNFTAAMVTDEGGVDDKSFNQSAWEGLVAYGEDNNLEKGKNGYNYYQSKNEADFSTNLNAAVRDKFDIIYGVGFKLTDAIAKIADQRKDNHFVIVDAVVPDKDNVASLTFKEHEGSYLVGVVAGLTTKSNKIGFIGGIESDLINKFAAGFQAGVKEVNPNAKVEMQFAGTFTDSSKAQAIAAAQYSSGVDIIYHAAGGAGLGVFTEAKNLKQKDPNRDIWVIGVDRDQHPEGDVKIGDKTDNITLTSMVKRVDVAVQDVTTKAKDGNFPGGEIVEYGMEENGIKISDSKEHLTDEVLTKVTEYEGKIKNGDVTVPDKLK
ncbi:BMP family lipoprotein [Lederbergia panacisoli]|uniref:BMP family lipoprotein n=1 Tax=Lederbergia panacisoli TaxID=1255251 RepID=UPI00214BECE6|nr:BMP family protein [Lederbergia panacisoli]MCR2820658.1 BMP family protein [Lederbergia panacisoli]